jgi:hypothetical protein
MKVQRLISFISSGVTVSMEIKKQRKNRKTPPMTKS